MAINKELDRLVDTLLERWPEHTDFIRASVRSRNAETLKTSEILASAILKITGDQLDSFCDDYRKTCEALTEEEYYFRRNGSYRYSRYDEVANFVYHNPDYMQTYIRGLLLSQVLWKNHAEMLAFYQSRFLAELPKSGRHLEIGPGHGLLMHLAMIDLDGFFEGWDISETSLLETERCLSYLQHDQQRYSLMIQDAADLSNSDSVNFDSITISEVLEHTENPEEILSSLHRLLTSNGRIFVNIPINSPAIDHIYHFKKISEVHDLIRNSGFTIIDHEEIPMGGYTLEKAEKLKATVTCAVTAKPV